MLRLDSGREAADTAGSQLLLKRIEQTAQAAEVETDLAATARLTAGWRATETQPAELLFRDPWAAALAGPDVVAGFSAMPPESQDRFSSYTVVRTRVFDDWFTSVQVCAQVVLLGAGLDTRAFRLAWLPNTTLWELDQAEVLQAKDGVLGGEAIKPGCIRRTLATDLTRDEWPALLTADGFTDKLPTAWLAEGLLPYLMPEEPDALLTRVARLSATGSQFAGDFVSATFMAAHNAYFTSMQAGAAGLSGALFHFGTDDPRALLVHHGWRVDTVLHPGTAMPTSAVGVGRRTWARDSLSSWLRGHSEHRSPGAIGHLCSTST